MLATRGVRALTPRDGTSCRSRPPARSARTAGFAGTQVTPLVKTKGGHITGCSRRARDVRVRASADLVQHAASTAEVIIPTVVLHVADLAQGFEGMVDGDLTTTTTTTATAFTALSPRLDSTQEGFSIFRGIVRGAQNAMGLAKDGVDMSVLPTGGIVETLIEPGKVFGDAVQGTRMEAATGAGISDSDWTKVVDAVDVDIALLLLSVVTVTPLCRALNVSPVLGFLGTGLLLNQEGLFSENREVDQFCELGIQFLLFEMGLELSVSRLKALGKYAFGLGLNQVIFGNILFAAALLPPGHALGTAVLEKVQSGIGVDGLLQITTPLEAVVVGFGLTLSSSALGLQLMSDRGMMTTKLGTASLGVLLFQDLAVVPFIILLPILQKLQSGDLGADGGLDYGIMAATTATSFLDLGVLSYLGFFAAKSMYGLVKKLDCGTDVFVALSLLVLFGFSNATAAIGFSDSLGAFLAGLVLAGTPYAHDIIAELRAFKGLFLSLFFVTIGTTIDLPLAIDLFPIVAVMTAGLMAGKIGVVTALGPITGLTWRESLVAGAFLAQGGEFAFVIFGQATSGSSGSLFPQNLDELLVVVVISSMALTPVAVDLALKIAGPSLDLSNCEDEPKDQLLTTIDEADGFGGSADFFDMSGSGSGSGSQDWVKLSDLSDDLREKGGASVVKDSASENKCGEWASDAEEQEACDVAFDIQTTRRSVDESDMVVRRSVDES